MIPGFFSAGAMGGGGGGGDPDWANVVSLLHFDGTNGSHDVIDEVGKTWTMSTPTLDTSVPKFGTAAALFTGSGSCISENTMDATFGTNDFTVEWFVRMGGTHSGNDQLFDGRRMAAATGVGLSVYVDDFDLKTQANTTVTTGTLTANTWHHVALARQSGTLRTFIDGVQTGSQTDTRNYTGGAQLFIGSTFSVTQILVGHIDEFRATKNVARYTAGFTPPSAPFPNF